MKSGGLWGGRKTATRPVPRESSRVRGVGGQGQGQGEACTLVEAGLETTILLGVGLALTASSFFCASGRGRLSWPAQYKQPRCSSASRAKPGRSARGGRVGWASRLRFPCRLSATGAARPSLPRVGTETRARRPGPPTRIAARRFSFSAWDHAGRENAAPIELTADLCRHFGEEEGGKDGGRGDPLPESPANPGRELGLRCAAMSGGSARSLAKGEAGRLREMGEPRPLPAPCPGVAAPEPPGGGGSPHPRGSGRGRSARNLSAAWPWDGGRMGVPAALRAVTASASPPQEARPRDRSPRA